MFIYLVLDRFYYFSLEVLIHEGGLHLIRYVVGCLVVALVLFLLFVATIFALIYFFAGDFIQWLENTFQQIPDWLKLLIQISQQN